MRDLDGISGGSGLEIASACPRCGPRSMLEDQHTQLEESTCPTCGACLISGNRVETLVNDVLGMNTELWAQLAARGRPCALRCLSCKSSTQTMNVRGTNVDSCARCGALWFEGGALHALTGGRFGRPGTARPAEAIDAAPRGAGVPAAPFARRGSSRAAPERDGPPRLLERPGLINAAPPPPRRAAASTKTVAIAVASAVVLIGAGIGVRAYMRSRVAEVELAAAPSAAAPPVTRLALDPLPPAPTAARELVFSGRSQAWWSQRLTALRTRDDEEGRRLYALTRQRAEANGLTVTERGAAVEVAPSPELLAKIAARGGGG